MNFKKNEIEIIKLLISSAQYVSSYEIAELTGINRRAVRVEMTKVKDILKSLGYHLISKPSRGYMIDNKSLQSMMELSKVIENIEKERESLFPVLDWEKRNYIMKRLIEYGDFIRIDDLADELLLSRSAVSNVIREVRKYLKKYHLTLEQKPNYGIRIVGYESDKRKALCDFLFFNLNQSEMVYDFLNSFISDQHSLEYQIIEILNKHHIILSDIALCDFFLTLSIAIYRFRTGHIIQSSPLIDDIETREEFIVAKEIAYLISKKSNCTFNAFEINEIAIEIICKRSVIHNMTLSVLSQQIANEIFNEIYKRTYIDLKQTDLKDVFSNHIEMVLMRMRFDQKIRTPIFDEVRNIYPLAYYFSQITASVVEKYTQNQLSKSTLSYFTTLFNSSLIQICPLKKRALLLCGLGAGTETQGKYVISKEFNHLFDIIKVTQFYQLPQEDLNHYDFIISTIPIHKKLSIPCINISQFTTNNDLKKIDSYLSLFFNLIKLETMFHPLLYKANVHSINLEMIMNEFFHMIKLLYPDIKKSTKNYLFNEDNYSCLFYNDILIIKTHKQIYTNNILATIVLDDSIIWEENEVKVIILYSCIDENQYIIKALQNTCHKISKDRQAFHEFYNHPEYCEFMKFISKHS